jgi:hypothetical protein
MLTNQELASTQEIYHDATTNKQQLIAHWALTLLKQVQTTGDDMICPFKASSNKWPCFVEISFYWSLGNLCRY